MNQIRQATFDRTVSIPKWQFFNIGFWLLMFSWSVMGLSKSRWQIESQYISAPLLCFGMSFMLIGAFKYWKSAIKQLSSLNQMIFRFLIFWGVVTALRGFSSFELTAFRDNLGIRYFAWTWFVPVFMVLSMEPLFIRQLLKAMLKHGRLGLIILAIGWVPPIRLFTLFSLCWGCSALLIFWQYLSKWGRLVALIGAFLTIFFAILASERNALVGHGFLMLAASYIYMIRRHRFRGQRRVGVIYGLWRRLGIIYGFVLVAGVVYYAANHQNLPFFTERTESRIESFKEELPNTRGILFSDFLKDMDMMDLLFGRGAIGQYKSVASGGAYRALIECGYFQVILKGGVVMLFPMLLLAVPAMLKGLFTSRNWVVKGFAIIVAGWLLEMAPFGLPAAFPRYALFWFSIGICLNPALRNMTDEEIECDVLPQGAVGFGRSR
jgi:hypothetical protein